MTFTTTLPPQESGEPPLLPLSVIWNWSPAFAVPFGHDLVTVTVGAGSSLLKNVQVAFVGVVPAAIAAVAVLPENEQLVPVPWSNPYPASELSVMV